MFFLVRQEVYEFAQSRLPHQIGCIGWLALGWGDGHAHARHAYGDISHVVSYFCLKSQTFFRSLRFSTVTFVKEESPCPIRSQASENPPAKLPRSKNMLTSDAVLGYAKHGRAKWDEVKTVGDFFLEVFY